MIIFIAFVSFEIKNYKEHKTFYFQFFACAQEMFDIPSYIIETMDYIKSVSDCIAVEDDISVHCLNTESFFERKKWFTPENLTTKYAEIFVVMFEISNFVRRLSSVVLSIVFKHIIFYIVD